MRTSETPRLQAARVCVRNVAADISPVSLPISDIEAISSSRIVRGPSFYLGLFGPSLHLVQQRGIAFFPGLWLGAGPELGWMLPFEPIAAPGAMGTTVVVTTFYTSATSYDLLRYDSGLYASPLFHIASVIAASLREIVSFARCGFVPPAISLL